MKRYTLTGAIVLAATILAFAGLGSAQCGGGTHAGHNAQQVAATTTEAPVYPIDYCIVSGEKLGGMGDPVKYDYKGRTVMFCCGGCIKKFEAEPAKYIAALDAAIAASVKPAAQKASTDSTADSTVATVDSVAAKPMTRVEKLDWCIVSGEKLGEMGKPVAYKWKDCEMTFCCKGCVKEFEKTPAAYLARLDSALAGQIKQPVEAEAAKDSLQHNESHH